VAGRRLAGLRRRDRDRHPDELAWSKLKARLRAAGARSRDTLDQALGPALAAITARDARGWFRLAGYPAESWAATRYRQRSTVLPSLPP
jgi:hypothetical protein